MHRLICAVLVLAGGLSLAACDFDNYDPPESDLQGALVYEGEPIGVRQNAIDLELWEEGYELRNALPMNVHQDGTFAATLFDGEYQVVRQQNGPWVTTTDSVFIQVDGSSVTVSEGEGEVASDGRLLISVTPYFMLRDVNLSISDTTVTASFDVEQVADDAALQQVGLYVNRTQFVSAIGAGNYGSTVQPADSLESLSGVQLTLPLTEDQRDDQATVYARVGVFTQGTPEALYSQVVALDLSEGNE